jgi:hypothetical protein
MTSIVLWILLLPFSLLFALRLGYITIVVDILFDFGTQVGRARLDSNILTAFFNLFEAFHSRFIAYGKLAILISQVVKLGLQL